MTMKIALTILLFFPLFTYSQRDNFYNIDHKVTSIPFAKADSLAKQLAALGNTDREKVRAIFRWITEHIDYNVVRYSRQKINTKLFYEEPEDSNAALPSLNERVATKVLYKKVAFCDGYSRLFKTLCDHAGIKAEVIFGYGRNNTSKRFGVNHTWNAVYIDSSWHLLDVTWASGFVTYSNAFIRNFNESYFLTPPHEFIRDHYPADLQWTLLSEPPVLREFNQGPFRYSGYMKAGISDHYPSKGIIEVAAGDSILIEFKTKSEIRNFYVSDIPVFDSANVVTVAPTFAKEKFSFKYPITPATGEWLYVFCNDEPALRYRLNVKKEPDSYRVVKSE